MVILIYGSVEFYGVNVNEKMESDLIVQTLYLHQNFPITAKFYAFGNRGDGLYCLVDGDDVFEFDLANNTITKTGQSLYEYILKLFQEEKDLEI